MAIKKNSLSRLLALDGAITSDQRKSIHTDVVATRSPALNFIFGKGHGLPKGYSMLLYGPPRGGKSVICNEMIGWLHQSDPDAVAIKFNTEMRETAQLDDETTKMYGIDPERLIAYEVNQPDQIFDRIEKEIAAEVQDGLKVGLVIIDSLNSMQGRRGMNADTIMTQQIGDNAATIQEGLKRILPVQRKCKFALVLTSHIRAQMEKAGGSAVVHTSQTTAIRPAVSYGTQHHCEYYVYVSPVGGQDGKMDASGKKFIDESVTDFREEGERTAHKIMARMMDSSLGPKGRAGVFTFDYNHGIVNQHEEVFYLGVSRGVITKPNNVMYQFGGKEWRGKGAILEALRSDPQLQQAVLTELRQRDIDGSIHSLPEDALASTVAVEESH
jgi:RecA/RadA recombinase